MNKIDSFTILWILLIISFYTTWLLFTNNYIPYYIVKKESKIWKNIRNEMLDLVENKLEKAIEDIENENFTIYENK